MTASRIVRVLLLLGVCCARADAAEGDALAAAAARYYADGLQAPMLQIRAGTAIVGTCKKRFRSMCSKRHREAADKARYTARVSRRADAVCAAPKGQCHPAGHADDI